MAFIKTTIFKDDLLRRQKSGKETIKPSRHGLNIKDITDCLCSLHFDVCILRANIESNNVALLKELEIHISIIVRFRGSPPPEPLASAPALDPDGLPMLQSGN